MLLPSWAVSSALSQFRLIRCLRLQLVGSEDLRHLHFLPCRILAGYERPVENAFHFKSFSGRGKKVFVGATV